MDARQKAIVEALGMGAVALRQRAPEFGPRGEEEMKKVASTLDALAKAIEGGQEAWQHRGDPEAVHTIEDDDEPHDWIKSDYRRVLVIEWPEEKP